MKQITLALALLASPALADDHAQLKQDTFWSYARVETAQVCLEFGLVSEAVWLAHDARAVMLSQIATDVLGTDADHELLEQAYVYVEALTSSGDAALFEAACLQLGY